MVFVMDLNVYIILIYQTSNWLTNAGKLKPKGDEFKDDKTEVFKFIFRLKMKMDHMMMIQFHLLNFYIIHLHVNLLYKKDINVF